ncbi:MAG: putative nucleotidyltransferase substrate binding domain-containing protein [Nitrospirota bacterium]
MALNLLISEYAIMLKEETIEFIRRIPPFDRLTEEELAGVAEDVSMEYYPKGVKILTQDGPPSEYLRLIKKGGVKVYITSKEDKDIVIDYRTEGEQFGLLSLIGGDRSRANVLAVEDTICYLIGKEKVLAIQQGNPAVNEFFLKSFFINFVDRAYEETRRRYTGLAETERLLFTTTVGEIVKREPVTGGEDMSIREAARRMAENKVSSLVIVGPAGIPLGIVTDRDLREKVVARGRDLSGPVASIMSSPLIRVDADEYCFEAVLKMMRYKIHHILVVQRGAFRGVVTNHDLMVLQGTAPTVLVKEMEGIHSLDSLGETTVKIHKSVATLLREGARAQNITGLVTELVEKLLNRVVDILEKKTGPSPLPYALFMLGEGARRELTLDLPIRMGVVLADTNNLNVVKAAEEHFAALVERLNAVLPACGYRGGRECIDVENVQSLGDWKHFFDRWAREPESFPPQGPFFDMRSIRGEDAFVQELRDHLLSIARQSEEVMDLLAAETVENRPPLGFFRRFVVEKSGEHRNELDLCQKGIRPLVDAVRVFALQKGIEDVSTFRRLLELKDRHGFELAGDVEQVLDYLLALLLHMQLGQAERGLEPDGFVNPDNLSLLEKKTLKESFQLTASLFEVIEKSYKTERVLS